MKKYLDENLVLEVYSPRSVIKESYKQDLIDHADYYKNQVSENAALWIDLLVRFSKRKFIKIQLRNILKIKR